MSFGDGRISQTYGNIMINMRIDCLPSTEFKVTFDVLKSKEPIIILGMIFLMENNCKIDLENDVITIDKQEFELDLNRQDNALEKNLIQKTECNSIFEKYQEEIKELVTEAQQNNPRGNRKIQKHQILMKQMPVQNKKRYTIPLSIRDEAEKFIKDLENKKIIQKCFASFVSPAFFIKKANGELRLVIDYRDLNKCNIPQQFPIPKIHDQLTQLNGSTVFSQLDLKSGYYQIQMDENDIHKTAFIISNQTYCFNVMPFGLSSAPATFQRAMMDLLGHLKFVKIYLDDILVHSKSLPDHLQHLKCVSNILHENIAEINFNKSVFCTTEVKYLGHILSKNGSHPDTSRIESLIIPNIRSKRDIQKIWVY